MDDKKEFPSFFDQVKNLSKLSKEVARDFLTGNEIYVDESKQFERLSICQACDQRDRETNRCYLCGCYLENKVKFNSSSCPLMKW